MNGSDNPCGKGTKPSKCTCPDGTSYKPDMRLVFKQKHCSHKLLFSTVGTCGKSIPDCVCPNGKKFKPPQDLIRATAKFHTKAEQKEEETLNPGNNLLHSNGILNNFALHK